MQLQALESSRVPVGVQITPSSAAVPSGDLDSEALVFLVLMQAAQSAHEELKAIMEQVKAINASKEKLRCLFDKAQAARPLRHGTLDFESVFK